MEYYTRYGLEFSPFLKNSKPIFVDTSEAKEVRYRLATFLKTLGFGVLTGGPGRGKTTLVKKWVDSLNPSLYCTFYSSLSTLTVQEFYRSLAQTMHLEPAFRKSDNFRLIHDEVVRLSLEKKCCPVIIIDEANSANSAILTSSCFSTSTWTQGTGPRCYLSAFQSSTRHLSLTHMSHCARGLL